MSVATSNYSAPSISAILNRDQLFRTSGHEIVRVRGRNFGPIDARNAVVGRFGRYGTYEFEVHCDVVVANFELNCTTPAYAGRQHHWSIWVVNQTSASSADTTSYLPPSITSISGDTLWSTVGNYTLLIFGKDFGPRGLAVGGTYYNDRGVHYTASCAVEEPHTVVRCITVAGIGIGYSVYVTTGGDQHSFSVGNFSFRPPVINGVETARPLDTRGGELIVLRGDNFGPLAAQMIRGRYAVAPVGFVFELLACNVSRAHVEVRCVSSTGVGMGLAALLVVGNQTSSVSPASLRYARPLIVIGGVTGGDALDTRGFNTIGAIVVGGNYFGPPAEYNIVIANMTNGNYTFTARCVVESQVKILCTAPSGIGCKFRWRVLVGGQLSNASDATTSFRAPVVSSVNAALLDTRGGGFVIISGDFFGSSTIPHDHAGIHENSLYTMVSPCRIVRNHTTVQCRAAPGVGMTYRWRIVVAEQTSAYSSDTTSFLSPVIHSVHALNTLSTVGGTNVTVTGNYFGPGWEFPVSRIGHYSFGPSRGHIFETYGCVLSRPQEEITCQSVPGVGRLLIWTLTIAGQTSPWSDGVVNYTDPVVSFVDGDVAFPSAGGVAFVLRGTNLGPIEKSWNDIIVRIDNGRHLILVPCIHSVDHYELRCLSPVGVGAVYRYVVIVGQQRISSLPSKNASNFIAPTIQAISGATTAVNVSHLVTRGGEVVILHGTHFGPSNGSFDLRHFAPTASAFYFEADDSDGGFAACKLWASRCAVVSHTQAVCTSAKGRGIQLSWHLQLDNATGVGAESAPSRMTTAFAAPAIEYVRPVHCDSERELTAVLVGSNFGDANVRRVGVGYSIVLAGVNSSSGMLWNGNCIVNNQNDSSSICTVPLGASPDQVARMQIVTDYRQRSNVVDFFYYELRDVTPKWGPARGGTSVSISGATFSAIPSMPPIMRVGNFSSRTVQLAASFEAPSSWGRVQNATTLSFKTNGLFAPHEPGSTSGLSMAVDLNRQYASRVPKEFVFYAEPTIARYADVAVCVKFYSS